MSFSDSAHQKTSRNTKKSKQKKQDKKFVAQWIIPNCFIINNMASRAVD